MALYCSEKEGDRMVDGLKGCTACIHQGRDTMEVWCEEGEEFYGFLPASAVPDLIHAAVEFRRSGFAQGEMAGLATARRMIHAAIGPAPKAPF